MKIFNGIRSIVFPTLLIICFSLNGFAEDYRQLSNLPTLYITTENKVSVTSKENYVKASIIWVDENGQTEYIENLGIRGRGNSTWGLAKKPYRIKFDKKQEFLGKNHAKAKSWTLLANYADKTLLRNAVAAYIGSFAGQPFTASAQFVDVVLNGKFLGNYQISDQIEIRPKRVDITEQEETPTAESNITGGYLLEVDGFAASEPVWFTTPRGVKITVKSPDEEVIANSQLKYIVNYIKDFENTLFSDDFKDPENGYRKFIDSETLASWYISTELTGNVDGFWSTYIYKEKDDDHIYWGPLWDYDIAFNNCNRVGDVSQALMTERGFGADLTKVWVDRMWQDPWFANLINDHWVKLVERGIENSVIEYIDQMAAVVDESQKLNYEIWPINKRVYNEIVLFDTYREGVDFLKKFIHDHVAFLTKTFARKAYDATNNIPSSKFDHDDNYYYRIVNKGTHKTVTIADNGTSVCISSENPDDESQEWALEPSGEYFRIINHQNGLAITDDAQQSGDSYVAGSQLILSEPDSKDGKQLWKVSPISTGASYCLINKETNLAWNNSGGKEEDGTSVISWSNDSQNENKTTRQWHLNKSTLLDGNNEAGIRNIESLNYRLTYNSDTKTLHFISYDNDLEEGNIEVISLGGETLLKSAISSEISLSGISEQIVIVRWTTGGDPHSLKLIL